MRKNLEMREIISNSYIITYREDASKLINALEFEGLNPTEMRSTYNDHEMLAPSSTRTFISHYRAWQRAAANEGYTLICESDFVPCRGLGRLPSFWPLDNPLAWGYLYQGSPRLLALVDGYLRGHCGPLVSYVLNAPVARILMKLFEQEFSQRDIREYYTFDVWVQWFAMKHGGEAYIPRKHYGEHGGLPNPDHGRHGLSRQGVHRADNLVAPLHFLPHYAHGSHGRYVIERAESRLYGFARLLLNRWIVETDVYEHRLSDKLRMTAIGFRRLL